MKTALVIGGAECVSEDFKKAMELFAPDAIYAVNDIGMDIERLDVWVTLHPEFMDYWKRERRKRGRLDGYETVCCLATETKKKSAVATCDRSTSFIFPGVGMTASGSSGLFAIKVALDDGYQVVLAGMPMRAEDGHFIRKQPWYQRDAFIRAWELAMPLFKDQVRSVSGWTKLVLGDPTPSWLDRGSDFRDPVGVIPELLAMKEAANGA